MSSFDSIAKWHYARTALGYLNRRPYGDGAMVIVVHSGFCVRKGNKNENQRHDADACGQVVVSLSEAGTRLALAPTRTHTYLFVVVTWGPRVDRMACTIHFISNCRRCRWSCCSSQSSFVSYWMTTNEPTESSVEWNVREKNLRAAEMNRWR